MATVHLSCEEATTAGLLPAVCMQCGQPSAACVWRSYSNGGGMHPPPPPPEPGMGCFLFVLWPIVLFTNFMAWMGARSMKVAMPLCAAHAKGGWFTSDPLTVEEITAQGITLSGVADEFVLALTRLRRGEAPTGSKGEYRP